MGRSIARSVSVLCICALSAFAQNKVIFDNQSGEPALVRLIGPTTTQVGVANGVKAHADAEAGRYTIKVRYGTPGNYRYSKGEEFEVKETATARSETTITLHKVVAGNYGSKPISEEEFSKAGRSADSPERSDPEMRTWTDANGRRAEASLVEASGSAVTLKGKGGETRTVPLGQLSETDRRYVEERVAQQGAAGVSSAPMMYELREKESVTYPADKSLAGTALTGNILDSATGAILCTDAEMQQFREAAKVLDFTRPADRDRLLQGFLRVFGQSRGRKIGLRIHDDDGKVRYVWPAPAVAQEGRGTVSPPGGVPAVADDVARSSRGPGDEQAAEPPVTQLIAGTRWRLVKAGTDRSEMILSFREDGTLSFTSNGALHEGDGWKEEGGIVRFSMNNHYAEYEGALEAEGAMAGTGKSAKSTWRWRATRMKVGGARIEDPGAAPGNIPGGDSEALDVAAPRGAAGGEPPSASSTAAERSAGPLRMLDAPEKPALSDGRVIALVQQAAVNRGSSAGNSGVVTELGELEADDAIWALVDMLRDPDQQAVTVAAALLLRRDAAKVRGAVLRALEGVPTRSWAQAIPLADRAAWASIGLSRIDAPQQGPPMERREGSATFVTLQGPDKGARETVEAVVTRHPVTDTLGNRIVVKRSQEAANRYDRQGRLQWGKVTVVTPYGYVVTAHSENPVTVQQAMQLLQLAGNLETGYRGRFPSVGTLYTEPSQADQRFIRVSLDILSRGPDGAQVVDAWQRVWTGH